MIFIQFWDPPQQTQVSSTNPGAVLQQPQQFPESTDKSGLTSWALTQERQEVRNQLRTVILLSKKDYAS